MIHKNPASDKALMISQDGLSSSAIEAIAGLTAGIVSTLTLHPLDLVKTRLQVNRSSDSRYGSSLRVIRDVARNEGGITAFYRGLAPNLVGNSLSWSVYFLCYGNIKDMMLTWKSGPRRKGLTSWNYFAASGIAGLVTAALTNPIWVIKTRMLSTGSRSPGAYPTGISGVVQIYQTEGVMGFYRGLVPSLFGVSHGAFQFMAYEQLKAYRHRSTVSLSADVAEFNSQQSLGNAELFVISSLSKMFAGTITYPYQVLRSRLQTYDAHLVYCGVGDAIHQIRHTEGMLGFWKGFGPNLFRVLPSTWVTFLVYENMRAYLPGKMRG